MAYQSEAELENLLIKQLGEEGYEEIEVKDYREGPDSRRDKNGCRERILAGFYPAEDPDEREVHRRCTFTEDSHHGLPDQEAGRQQRDRSTILCGREP